MFFPIKDNNPTRRPAIVTIIFIALNILIYFFQTIAIPSEVSEAFNGRIDPLKYNIAKYAMVPKEVTHLKPYNRIIGRSKFGSVHTLERKTPVMLTLFFSLFMHGSFMHLFGNMIFLWIFGNNIEDYLGRFKFILFYLATGIIASLSHILFNWDSMIPVIGASGAVSGVMGAYLILYPQKKVKTLVFVLIFITFIDIPAAVFLVIWFLFQFSYSSADGVAFLAHIGGFIAGIILIKLWKKRKKPPIQERVIEFIP